MWLPRQAQVYQGVDIQLFLIIFCLYKDTMSGNIMLGIMSRAVMCTVN